MAAIFVQGTLQTGTNPAVPFVLTDRVGITTVGIAAVTAAVGGLIFFGVLGYWAHQRGIRGGWLLRIISMPGGYASLSQFQIFVWTVVIGLGVIYVMMLSGNLIDVPLPTLGLLGVSGFALVGAKLQAGSDGSPQRVSAPGAVTNLAFAGTPTSDTVVLTWTQPDNAAQPYSFTIQKRLSAGGTWDTVASNIGGPPYAVINLNAGTSYDFQVFAINQGGAGPASVPLTQATAAASAAGTAPAAGGPGKVTGVTTEALDDARIELRWAPLSPAPGGCSVQYRKVATLPWATYSTSASSPTVVGGLHAGTNYEFQVFAVTGGIAGPPSPVAADATRARRNGRILS